MARPGHNRSEAPNPLITKASQLTRSPELLTPSATLELERDAVPPVAAQQNATLTTLFSAGGLHSDALANIRLYLETLATPTDVRA